MGKQINITYIFLDTNIFLHCRPIEQINWLEIVGSDKVTIVIAPVVIRELDEIKAKHPRNAIRDRARIALKKIESVQIEGSTLDFHEGIDLLFVDEPSIEFEKNGLFRDIPDDHLIASCLAFRETNPDAHIVLITYDTAPRIKAHKRGIDPKKLPEGYKLPDSTDEAEKEIRQLQRRVAQLEHQIPKLDLSFADGKHQFKVSLPAPLNLTGDDIARRLVELREQYSKISPPRRREMQIDTIIRSLSNQLSELVQPVPEEFERYNEEIEAYYKKYEDYLHIYTEHENIQRRMICLDLILSNNGTAPAEDIDIFMHFPDGFALYREDDQPVMPREPAPPHTPRTLSEMMTFAGTRFMSPTPIMPHAIIPSIGNVSSLDIRRSNSYDVSFSVEKLKQYMNVPADPLFVVFDSFDTASPFGIEYRINAANLPEEINGTLNVVIEKESIDEG